MTSVLLQINWGNALIVTLVGFGLVIVLLIVLVFVLMAFSWFFTRSSKPAASPAVQAQVSGAATAAQAQPASSLLTDEELAAVAMAVNMNFFAVHDLEDLTLTISHESEGPSDWTSKYSVLNQE